MDEHELALVQPEAPNTQPSVYNGGYSDMIDTIGDDGYVTVPDGPGLGVYHDWEYIFENATGTVHSCE